MPAGESLQVQNIQPDFLASEVSRMWTSWDSAKPKERWKEVRDYVYATSTRETANAGKGGFGDNQGDGWSHSTHLPKLCQIRDNLHANMVQTLFPNENWVKYVGHDQASATVAKRKAVEGYVKTKARLSKLKNEISKCVTDALDTGNCFAEVSYVAEQVIDPDTGDIVGGYIGPRLTRISPEDIVFNPLATDFKRSPKIKRSIFTMGELHRQLNEDPTKGYYDDVIKKITGLRTYFKTYPEESEKYASMPMDGFGTFTDYLSSGYVELLEFYGDLFDEDTMQFYPNHVITVVDRQFVIRKEPIKTWSGQVPIFHFGWRQRPDNLWSQGPLENIVGMQYYIDHLMNTFADAFDDFVEPTVVTVGDIQEEGSKFGGLMAQRYHSDSADGSVNFLRPDATFLQGSIQQIVEGLENKMEYYAGAPREAMGIRSPGEKTAYEVQYLENGSGRMFQHNAYYFESEFLEEILNSFVEHGRRFLNGTDVIQVIDDDEGVQQFLKVTNQDLRASGKIVPMGSRHAAEQARLAQVLVTLQQVLTPEERMHIPSIDMARAIVSSAGVEDLLPVIPFVRIGEQSQAQRLLQVADQNTMIEDQIPVEADDEDLDEVPE